MRLIVRVPRRNWLPRPARPAHTMCTAAELTWQELFREVTGETDSDDDGKHSLHRGVQRANHPI